MTNLKRIVKTFKANLEQFFYVPPGYPKIRTFFLGNNYDHSWNRDKIHNRRCLYSKPFFNRFGYAALLERKRGGNWCDTGYFDIYC